MSRRNSIRAKLSDITFLFCGYSRKTKIDKKEVYKRLLTVVKC